MKANGATTKLMAVASFGMRTGMFMKDNGKRIRQMDTEFICMSMAQDMRVNGRMTCRMAKVLSLGVTGLSTRVVTKKA
jgi:hypothetical protein